MKNDQREGGKEGVRDEIWLESKEERKGGRGREREKASRVFNPCPPSGDVIEEGISSAYPSAPNLL